MVVGIGFNAVQSAFDQLLKFFILVIKRTERMGKNGDAAGLMHAIDGFKKIGRIYTYIQIAVRCGAAVHSRN